MAAVTVQLRNDRSGEIKRIKVGWSWVLFLFSTFLGIPLFLRRLQLLGVLFLVIWFINAALTLALGPVGIAVSLLLIPLSIWMGLKGNEITGKKLLETGWSFSDPDGENAKYAKIRWRLAQ